MCGNKKTSRNRLAIPTGNEGWLTPQDEPCYQKVTVLEPEAFETYT